MRKAMFKVFFFDARKHFPIGSCVGKKSMPTQGGGCSLCANTLSGISGICCALDTQLIYIRIALIYVSN
jgi:hypothetical protein